MCLDEVNKLYDGKPRDDATVCIVRIRERVPIKLLFSSPLNRDDCDKMMSLFFSKEGKHIVCGGVKYVTDNAYTMVKERFYTKCWCKPDI